MDGRPTTVVGGLADHRATSPAGEHALFNGEVLQPASLRRMIDPGISQGLPCPEGCGLPYGLGVVQYREFGRDLVGHYGGSGAIVAHDLGDHATIAITNGGAQDLGAFLRAVLDAMERT